MFIYKIQTLVSLLKLIISARGFLLDNKYRYKNKIFGLILAEIKVHVPLKIFAFNTLLQAGDCTHLRPNNKMNDLLFYYRFVRFKSLKKFHNKIPKIIKRLSSKKFVNYIIKYFVFLN